MLSLQILLLDGVDQMKTQQKIKSRLQSLDWVFQSGTYNGCYMTPNQEGFKACTIITST